MPVEWEREGRVFVIKATGSYAPEALIHGLDEILALEDLPERAGVLLDLRTSESLLKRSTRDMRHVAEYFAENSDPFGRRCALLVEGLTRYGLMRMAAAWADWHGVEAGVFMDETKARAWLEAKASASTG